MKKNDRGKKKVPITGSGSIKSFFKSGEPSISKEPEPSSNINTSVSKETPLPPIDVANAKRPLSSNDDIIIDDDHPSKHQRVEFDIGCLERDPALRTPI